jgi:HSP20 family protein
MVAHVEEIFRSIRASVATVWTPPLTMRHGDDEMVLLFELGGVPREAIELGVVKNELVVRGYRASPFDAPPERKFDDRMKISERPFGTFRRAVDVPQACDASRAVARLADGVLTVRIPKVGRSNAQPATKIRIE